MSLKYTDKVRINRENELEEYRNQILEILEDSKQLAMDCDNLVKIRALKARCEKISKPRPTFKTENSREEKRKNYHQNKMKYSKVNQDKRQKIRDIGKVDIGNFFNSVPV